MAKLKDTTKSRRFFHIGEIVFNANYAKGEEDNFDFGRITLINGKEQDALIGEDDIITLSMRHNNYQGDNECYPENIYKLCKKWTYKTGEPVCFEHHNFKKENKGDGENYPFFIPRADENYFRFELEILENEITDEERELFWKENQKLFIRK